MKMTISRLGSKTVVTKRGEAAVFSFYYGGRWYSSFAGSWNKDWYEGKEIDVAESQIRRTERNGHIFMNIAAPPKNTNPNWSVTDDANHRILEELAVFYKDLRKIKSGVGVQ